MGKIIASASGGLSSMMMAIKLKKRIENGDLKAKELVCIFANTGCENEQTLQFVHDVDKQYGLNIKWVEAVTNPKHMKGVTHRLTDFKGAFRANQYKHPLHPFHAHIIKNGIPNQNKPQCSDRLKEFAVEHYKKTHGLSGFPHAIGMRIDEENRATPSKIQLILNAILVTPTNFRNCGINRWDIIQENNYFNLLTNKHKIELKRYCKKLSKHNLIYPMCDMFPSSKSDVEYFWDDESLDLGLENHQGNCQTCWKKSHKKLYLIAKETPELFEAFDWWESNYQHIKPNTDGKPRYFFRGHKSAKMIIGESSAFEAWALRKMIGAELEVGCAEGCNGYLI